MKQISKDIKRRLNESESETIKNYNFRDSVYYISKLIKEQKTDNKGIFIELLDKLEDLEIAYKYTFKSIFGEQVLLVAGNIKKHKIMFIEDAENIKNDAWSFILNLIDGQIGEEKYNCIVILCSSTSNPMSEENPIRQRFINLNIYK